MSFKALELSASIADELRKRMAPLTVTEGFDTNGDPTLAIGAGSPGGKNAFVRTKAISWPLAITGLGLPATMVSPHVIQFVTEANYEGTNDTVLDVLTPVEMLPLIATLAKRGTQLEWYQSANGTAPVVASITSGNLKQSYDPELYWPLLSQG